MPRRPKDPSPIRVDRLSNHEIPPWVREVPLPRGEDDLEVVLSDALFQPSLMQSGRGAPPEYPDFFARLVARAKAEADRHPAAAELIALQLLHVAPGYVEVLDQPENEWLCDSLARVFRLRRYDLFRQLPKTRGRPSDPVPAATVAFLAHNMIAPSGSSRPVPQPKTVRCAIEQATSEEVRSPDELAAAGITGRITGDRAVKVSPQSLKRAFERSRAEERERNKRFDRASLPRPPTRRRPAGRSHKARR